MKYLDLTNDEYALVDDEDYARLCDFPWRKIKSGYACANSKRKWLYLHRIVMNAEPGEQIDHKNRDRLDCRKCNLRIVTSAQNHMNAGLHGRNTSGYKGVSFNKHAGRWRAYIGHDGKNQTLGYYSSREDAARAYNQKATELFGEYAYLNEV
jgi:hypothetical protein